jgi:hypothetical protein
VGHAQRLANRSGTSTVTILLAIALSGIALGVVAPMVLSRLRLERWPQLAACLWLAASGGGVGAVTLTGLLLLALVSDGQLSRLLHDCLVAPQGGLHAPEGAAGLALGGPCSA